MKMQYFIAGMRNTTPSNTVTNYASLIEQNDGAWFGTTLEANASVRNTAEGYITKLAVFITTAPGVGITRTFSVMVDGVEDTSTRVSFSGTTNGWQTVTFSKPVYIGKGSTLSLQAAVSGGTATGAGKTMWHATVVSHCYSFGGHNSTTSSTTLTEYMNPIGGHQRAWTVNGADWEIVIPCAGTLSTLYVDAIGGTVGAGGSYTFTVQKNGVDSILTCTLAANTQSSSDLTNSFTVAAGDKIVIKKVPTLAPTARGFKVAMRFVPSTSGQFFTGMGSNSSPSLTATQYQSLIGHGNYTWSATEATFQQGVPAGVTASAIYASMPTAPGVGKQWVIGTRVNSANSGSSVTIAGTSNTGNSSASSFTTSANDLVNYYATPTGTPTGPGGMHISTLWSMSSVSEDILNFGGAECGVVTAPQYGGADTANGTVAITASPMSFGGQAFRVNPTTTNTGSFLFSQYGMSTVPLPEGIDADLVYYEFRFRYATKSSAATGEEILDCRVPGASKATVRLDSSGNLRVYNSLGTLVSTGATVLLQDTDYVIGFKCGNGTSASYELRINGIVELSGTLNAGTTRHYGLRIGKITNQNSTSVDYYFDDVIVSDTALPNGKYRVANSLPNGTVSATGWTGGTGSTFAEIDDYADSTNYLKSNASNATFKMDMQDRSQLGVAASANGKVIAVKAQSVVRADSTSGSGIAEFATTTTSGSSSTFVGTILTYTTTETSPQYVFATNPGTNFVPWTSTEFDSMQLGMFSSASGLRVSSMWAEVLYQPGGSSNLLLLGVG